MEGSIVEAWQTYFRVDLFLVEALSGKLASTDRSAGQILGHMHKNRLNWLEHRASDLGRDVANVR